MTFAEWVAETRAQKRLTKAECARRAGVSQPVWTEYENREKTAQPRRDTVEKIADALGVSRSDALRAAGFSPNYSVVAMEIEDVATGERMEIEPKAWGDRDSLAAAISQIMQKLDDVTHELRELKQQK